MGFGSIEDVLALGDEGGGGLEGEEAGLSFFAGDGGVGRGVGRVGGGGSGVEGFAEGFYLG